MTKQLALRLLISRLTWEIYKIWIFAPTSLKSKQCAEVCVTLYQLRSLVASMLGSPTWVHPPFFWHNTCLFALLKVSGRCALDQKLRRNLSFGSKVESFGNRHFFQLFIIFLVDFHLLCKYKNLEQSFSLSEYIIRVKILHFWPCKK